MDAQLNLGKGNMTNYVKDFWELWTPMNFSAPHMEAYALRFMEEDIRSGMKTMALIFSVLLGIGILLNLFIGSDTSFITTSIILTALSVHVFISARYTKQIQALYLLGMALLIISSTAFVLLANKSGAFSIPLFVSVILIFAVIPIVPWGLREASLVIFLIYLIFTMSTMSNHGRFPNEVLLMLQCFMLSGALIGLTLVGRNASIRRKEIQNRFELEAVNEKIRIMSYQDPLTDAWNRRYLQNKYDNEAIRYKQEGRQFHFILFDINHFKEINDSFGHDYGDKILQWVVESFSEHLHPEDILVRMGGDEFTLIVSQEPEALLRKALESIGSRVNRIGHNDHGEVTMSFGMVRLGPDSQASFTDVYKKADKLLYKAKKRGGNTLAEISAGEDRPAERFVDLLKP